MGNKEPRTREEHVRTAILECLETGTAKDTQEITRFVKDRVEPTEADRVRANKRDGESKIDQIIANALQDGRFLCRNGFIVRTGKGQFMITKEGKFEVERERVKLADMSIMLEELVEELGIVLDGK